MKLIDKKILKLLSLNLRFTDSAISKSIKKPAQTVSNIKKRLIEKKIVTPAALFSGAKLNYSPYYLFLSFKKSPLDLQPLKDLEETIVIMELVGKYNLQLICYCKEDKELIELTNKIYSLYASNLTKISLTKHLSEDKWIVLLPEFDVEVTLPKSQKNIFKLLTKKNIAGSIKKETDFKLDNEDKKIIKELLKNPLASFTDLSKKTNLTYESVRQRIKKYISSNFLQAMTLIPNHSALNYHSYLILLKLTCYPKDYEIFLEQNDQIWYSAKLFGEYSMALYVYSKDPVSFSKQAVKIQNFFGENIISSELITIQKEIYNQQFPLKELN